MKQERPSEKLMTKAEEMLKSTNPLLEQAIAKQKQLQQAIDLLQELGERLDWAVDFCDYSDIKEVLSPLNYAVMEAEQTLGTQLETLEEAVDKYETDLHFALAAVDFDSDLRYYVEE